MRNILHMFTVFKDTFRQSPALRSGIILGCVGILLIAGIAFAAATFGTAPSPVPFEEEAVEQTDMPTLGADDGADKPENDGGSVDDEVGDEGAADEETFEDEEEEEPAVEYAGADAELVETLKGHSWVDADRTVTFDDDTMTITYPSGREPRKETYAVSNAETGQPTTEIFEDNGESNPITTTVTSFALTRDGEAFAATLSESLADTRTSYTLDLGDGTKLTAASGSDDLVIEESPAGLDEAVAGHEQELLDELRNWCSANAPTATSARWDGVAELDWVTNYSTVRLTLNDPQSTEVTCVLNVTDGSITIS